MLLEEFEALTGFYPDQLLYEMIEKEYMESHKTKEEFCKDYLKNRDGLANKAQRSASLILAKEKWRMRRKLPILTRRLRVLRRHWKKNWNGNRTNSAEMSPKRV